MRDRSSVRTKQLIGIMILRNTWYVTRVFDSERGCMMCRSGCVVSMSNFRKQSLCDAEVDSVSVIDCLRGKKLAARKLARIHSDRITRRSFPKLLSRAQSGISPTSLLIQYSFASLWKFNQRVTGLYVPSRSSVSPSISFYNEYPPKPRFSMYSRENTANVTKQYRTVASGHAFI